MKEFKSLLSAAILAAVFSGGCSKRNAESDSSIPPSPPPVPAEAEPVRETPRQTSTVVSQTSVVADTVVLVQTEPPASPKREDGKWSSDAIQRDPYGFIQDQIRDCDKLKAKIESQKIALMRMGKQAARTIEESDGSVSRYTAFLKTAKAAYKKAETDNTWPVTVNGYELDEDQLSDRISDALERIELAKKDRETAEALAKKVEIRQRALKAKSRELASLRLKLVQQAEQVKTNAALAELGDLSAVIGTIKDMTLEVDNPSDASLEDMTAEDPDAKKKAAVRAFLDE